MENEERVFAFLKRTFPGKDFTVEQNFKILRHEWETDGWGWVVKAGAEKHLLLSNHGSIVLADVSELHQLLKEHADAMSGLLQALYSLKP